MLNIGKLASGGAEYYLLTVASGVEDYYTGAGEAPGYWTGSASPGLGLGGLVTAETLRAVLAGVDPVSGEPLSSRWTGRSVPGFDLTFRAPKSVSLLWGLGNAHVAVEVRAAHDHAVGEALGYMEREAAFTRRGAGGREAVQTTGFVAAAFRHRASRSGDPLLHTHVLVANAGKAVDDGVWRTLDAKRLYVHAKTAGCLYQAVLRDQLTRRLGVQWQPSLNGAADIDGVPRDLIEEFSRRRADILAHMAERGETSAKAAQAATLETRKSKEYGVEAETLRQRWQARADNFGWTPKQTTDLCDRPSRCHPTADDLQRAADRMVSASGLTEHASTFTRRDVIQAWCNHLRNGNTVAFVERLTDTFLAQDNREIVALEPTENNDASEAGIAHVVDRMASVAGGHAGDELRISADLQRNLGVILKADGWTARRTVRVLLTRTLNGANDRAAVLAARTQRLADHLNPPAATLPTKTIRGSVIRLQGGRVVAVADNAHYSTIELLELERRVFTLAENGQHAGIAIATDESVNAALACRPTMIGEQSTMVRQLTTSGHAVEVVVGKAGAGKTFALAAANDAWQASGVHVIGCALAARAATGLQAGAGIPGYTIDRLLLDAVRHGFGNGLAAGSVIVVDEAGMVGTRKLARLLDLATTAHAKVVLVGDHHQLPEVDAGGMFRALAERLNPIELHDNRRQRHAWDRHALDELRTGDPAAMITAYRDAGRLHVGDTQEAVREELVGDWWTARIEHGTDGIMIASRIADVEDLNLRARERMQAAGELTGPRLRVAGLEFAVGDEVMCLRNDRYLHVVNGTRGHVVCVDAATTRVTIATSSGQRTLSRHYLQAGHAAHSYAITVHKAQGLTAENTWVLGSDDIYREWGYTALSRHRTQARLYIANTTDIEPHQHPHTLSTPPSRTDDLINQLRRSRLQDLANESNPDLDKTHRGNPGMKASSRPPISLGHIRKPHTALPPLHLKDPSANKDQSDTGLSLA